MNLAVRYFRLHRIDQKIFRIGSSVLSRVISSRAMFEPMLKPKGSDDLDHERDITLAIHAAIPDLIKLKRHQSLRHTGWQLPHDLGGMVRPELTGEAGLPGRVIQTPITAARRRYKSKGPFDDR